MANEKTDYLTEFEKTFLENYFKYSDSEAKDEEHKCIGVYVAFGLHGYRYIVLQFPEGVWNQEFAARNNFKGLTEYEEYERDDLRKLGVNI